MGDFELGQFVKFVGGTHVGKQGFVTNVGNTFISVKKDPTDRSEKVKRSIRRFIVLVAQERPPPQEAPQMEEPATHEQHPGPQVDSVTEARVLVNLLVSSLADLDLSTQDDLLASLEMRVNSNNASRRH